MKTPSAWALSYRGLGWSVIPVQRGGKRPLVMWEEFQKRAASEQEIRGWFRRWPDANVGIVTGVISGLIVLDMDVAHGGKESLEGLEKRYSAVPKTVSARTGGGGMHLYFRHPGGTVHNKVGLAAGLDLRGDGGYVVAPPSLHPSGRRYAWQRSSGPDAMAPAPAPAWLLELISGEAVRRGHSVQYWQALVREGVSKGARNNTIASLAGHLLWHEVDPVIVLDLLLCWNAQRCRPPLSEEEVAETVQSVTRTHFRHREEET